MLSMAARTSIQPPETPNDMVFGFFDENEGLSPTGFGSEEHIDQNFAAWEQVEENEEKENDSCGTNVEEDSHFWENQHQLLKATLYRTSSLESKIRNITKETIKELEMAGRICGCGGGSGGGCRNCLMDEVSGKLRNFGYHSAICKTKWKGSSDIPSGEHTFLDVTDNSSPKKGEVRVIIELNFRAEFEMAKTSQEYSRLVQRLPEIFVGKVDRLNVIIKILCGAAKKCTKEKKMHLGPWRKHKYMQAKWLGTCERNSMTKMSSELSSMRYNSVQSRKPRASMLTVDLLDVNNIRHATVEIV